MQQVGTQEVLSVIAQGAKWGFLSRVVQASAPAPSSSASSFLTPSLPPEES